MKKLLIVLSLVLIFSLLTTLDVEAGGRKRKCRKHPELCPVPTQITPTPTPNVPFFPYPAEVGTHDKQELYDSRPHLQ